MWHCQSLGMQEKDAMAHRAPVEVEAAVQSAIRALKSPEMAAIQAVVQQEQICSQQPSALIGEGEHHHRRRTIGQQNWTPQHQKKR